MEVLTKKEFGGILASLLAEKESFGDYIFTEMKHPSCGYDMIRVHNRDNVIVDLVLDGFYSTYIEGKSINEIVELASEMIINDIEKNKAQNAPVEEQSVPEDVELEDEIKGFLENVLGLNIKGVKVANVKTNVEEPKENPKQPDSSDIEEILNIIDDVFSSSKDIEKKREELLNNVEAFLVNKNQEEQFADYLCKPVLGMLLVYHTGGNCLDKNILTELNINESELYESAINNLIKQHPVKYYDAAGHGVVITNYQNKDGATTILYPNSVKKFASMSMSNLIIVPLSKDACYVTPETGNYDNVRRLIEQKKDTVLTNKPIRYNRIANSLSVMATF